MEKEKTATSNQERMNKKTRRNGFSLPLVMCTIALLLVIGVGTLSIGMQSRHISIRTSTEISARSAADSGVTHAVYTLNNMLKDKYWSDESMPSIADEPLPYCNASFSYKTRSYSVKREDEGYEGLFLHVESTGKSGQSRKRVSCILELEGLFEYAIFTHKDILLRNGTTVSAYNVEDDDLPLMIGTNSTYSGAIDTKLGVTIDGDVIIGPGGDPDVAINSARLATITGTVYPSLVANKTPIIDVPKYLSEAPSNGEINESTTLTSNGKYESIDLVGNVNSESITIKGDVTIYVTGDIRLGNGDELIVHSDNNSDSQLVIYLGGNLVVDNGGSVNNLTKDSNKLKIIGLETCEELDFKNSGSFYGAIYAPEADIHLYNSVQMYGSVVSNSFVQDVDADFHYDMSLREVEPHDIGVHFVIKRWRDE